MDISISCSSDLKGMLRLPDHSAQFPLVDTYSSPAVQLQPLQSPSLLHALYNALRFRYAVGMRVRSAWKTVCLLLSPVLSVASARVMLSPLSR